jgi:hypothetical protein
MAFRVPVVSPDSPVPFAHASGTLGATLEEEREYQAMRDEQRWHDSRRN